MDKDTEIYALKTFAYLFLLCVLLWKYASTHDTWYFILLIIGVILYAITIYVTMIRPLEKGNPKIRRKKNHEYAHHQKRLGIPHGS